MVKRRMIWAARYAGRIMFCALMGMSVAGCQASPPRTGKPSPLGAQRVFALKQITPQQAADFLTRLNLGTTTAVPGRNEIVVTGIAGDLYRAGILLDLVDTRDEFVIKTLAPVSDARSIATNTQIAAALGGVSIGTFTNPPAAGERTRAIIDIHGPSVVAIIPARLQNELLAFVQRGREGLRHVRGEAKPRTAAENAAITTDPPVAQEQSSAGKEPNKPAGASPTREAAAAGPEPSNPATPASKAENHKEAQGGITPVAEAPAEPVCSVAGQTSGLRPPRRPQPCHRWIEGSLCPSLLAGRH
jgi:hypothetical protein